MRKIFLILGKAGAGKDTLANIVSKKIDIPIALSFTTRPMRKGENEGREYNFISLSDYVDLEFNDKLAERTSYKVSDGDTWYYGYSKEELEKDEYVIVIVNPEGKEQLEKLYGDKVVSIYVYSDPKERLLRYLNREEMNSKKIAECCRRYLADEEDFDNIEVKHIINNEILECAAKDLETIIRIEMGNDLLKKANELFHYDPDKILGVKI